MSNIYDEFPKNPTEEELSEFLFDNVCDLICQHYTTEELLNVLPDGIFEQIVRFMQDHLFAGALLNGVELRNAKSYDSRTYIE